MDDQDDTQHTPVQLDWLKPNEKIELVTGMDDESPTLRVTAREWAPSQAALTAAAQAAVLPSLESQDMDDEDSNAGGPTTTLEPRANPTNPNILLSSNLSEDEDDDDDVPVSRCNRHRIMWYLFSVT